MAKQVHPKNEATTSDILKEAGNAAPKPQEAAKSESDPNQGNEPPEPPAKQSPLPEENKGIMKGVPTDEEEALKKDKERSADEQKHFEAKEAARLEDEAKVNADNEKKNELASAMKRKYGENPVLAVRGAERTVFTRVAWENLKADKDGTKAGWREFVQVPPEVQALMDKKTAL